MFQKLSYLTLLVFFIPMVVFSQNPIDSKAALEIRQMVESAPNNVKQDLNFDEEKFLRSIHNKSSSVKLPFLGKDLVFTKTEYSMYGPEASPWDDIKTYKIVSKEDPLLKGRIVTGPLGVNILYLHNGKLIRVAPENDFINGTRSYFQEIGVSKDEAAAFGCGAHGDVLDNPTAAGALGSLKEDIALKKLGKIRRRYRVAVSCTGEYYRANGNSSGAVRNAAIALLSDISALFESEVNIELYMANGSPSVKYTDPASDPYNPDGNRTGDAQSTISGDFNNSQYDIGHVFHTMSSGGSGVAGLGVVCRDSRKASAWSGFSTGSPSGFALLAAHEFGHQFNCPHTFNGDGANCEGGNHPSNTAYEIGSGNTLMSYNGICGAEWNYPERKNPVFHANSLNQILDHVTANVCNESAWLQDENTVPIVQANPCGAVYRIPRNTPFTLKGEASDADGDVLTYTWEQYDEDGVGSKSTQGFIGNQAANSTIAPILRNYAPSSNPTRDFPSKSIQLAGLNSDKFERLPAVARTLHFRFVARDNNPAGGAVNWQEVTVRVVNGSLNITAPNGGETFEAGDDIDVSWTAAGLNDICQTAQIRLSADGGITFPYLLKDNVDLASSSTSVTIPAGFSASDNVRIQIVCADYDCFDFYKFSNSDITVNSDCSTPNNSLCDTEFLFAEFRDPALNLGLDNSRGNAIVSLNDQIPAGSDEMDAAIFNSAQTGCSEASNDREFLSYSITPTVTGTYTFIVNDNAGNVEAYSIFNGATFSRSNPCPSFLSSNARTTSNGNFNTVSTWQVDLDACTNYVLTAVDLTGDRRVRIDNITGPGLLLAERGGNANSDFIYAAVDELTSTIVMVNANSDFTLLNPGTFQIHSIYYETGIDPSSFVGRSISQLQSSGQCINVSANSKEVTIDASCAILNLTALDQAPCESNGSTYSQTISFEVGMGPTTGEVTIVANGRLPGTTAPINPGTNTVNLQGLLADGKIVNLNFSFSADAGCVKTQAAVFRAPENCCNIDIELVNQDGCIGDIAMLDAGSDGLTYEWFLGTQSVFGNSQTITPVEEGTYTVVVSDFVGCVKTESASVSFNEPPVVIINDPDPIILCEGDDFRLDVDTGNRDSIAWLLGGQPLIDLVNVEDPFITQTGIYTIETFKGGCARSAQIFAEFLPNTPFTLGDDRFGCTGNVVELGPLPDDLDYIWFNRFAKFDTLSFTNTLTVTDQGQYIAIGSNAAGCESSDTILVQISTPWEIDLRNDVELCDYESYQIIIENRNNPVEWARNGEIDVTNTSNTLKDPLPGTWTATIRLSDDCFISDTVLIEYIETLDVDLGPDLSFCEGEPFEVEIVAGPNSAYIYKWYKRVNGNAVFIPASSIIGSLEITEPGIYEVFAETKNTSKPCRTSDQIIIETVSQAMISFPVSTIESCPEDNVTLEAMASSDAITWEFDDGSGPIILSNLSGPIVDVNDAGTYTASIAKDQICGASASITVVFNDAPETILNTVETGCTGSVVDIIGSTSTSDEFIWLMEGTVLDGENSGTLSVTEPGEYVLTARNPITGCITKDTTFVGFIDAPTVRIDEEMLGGCNGELVTITATSNIPSVIWTQDGIPFPQIGQTIQVSESGVYTAIVGLGQTCEMSDQVDVTILDSPVVDLGGDLSLCNGSSELLQGPTGTGLIYRWYENDILIVSETSDTLLIDNATSTTYRLDVENAAGCSGTDEIELSIEDATDMSFLESPIDICAEGISSREIRVNIVSGPDDNLVWYKDDVLIQGETDSAIETTGSGVYRVVSKEGEDCESEAEVVVTWHDPPVIMPLGADQTLCEGDDTELDAGDNPDYTYAWRSGASTLSMTSTLIVDQGGEYVLEVRDAFGCFNRDTINIEFESQTTVELPEMVTLCPGANLLAETNASSVTWYFNGTVINQTDPELIVTDEGNYRAVAGEGTTCESEDSTEVTFSDAPDINLPFDPVVDCQGETISVTAGADDAFTYTWRLMGGDEIKSGGEGSLDITTSGSYIVSAVNAGDCETIDTVVAEFLTTPDVNLEATYEYCSGEIIELTAEATDVTAVKWYIGTEEIIGETTTTLTITDSGTYRIVAGEGLACSDEATTEVTFLDAPDISLPADPLVDCEGETVNVAAGPDDAFTYTWRLMGGDEIKSGGEGSIDLTMSGTYIVSAVNTADCETIDTVVAEFLTTPDVELEMSYEFCLGEPAELVAESTNVSNVKWYKDDVEIMGETSTTLTVTEPGSYRIIAGEGLPCNDEASTEVTFLAAPDISLEPLENGCTGVDVVLTAGADGEYNYTWSDDSGVIQDGPDGSLTVTVSGNYSVLATNQANCESNARSVVEIIDTPIVDIDMDEVTFCDNDDVTEITGSTSTMSVTWLLDGTEINGEMEPTLAVSVAGSYTMIAGFNTLCERSDSIEVLFAEAPEVTLEDKILCQDTSFDFIAGTNATDEYEWSINGTPVDNITGTLTITEVEIPISGMISVVVTNNSGCSEKADAEVEFVEAPMISLPEEFSYCEGETGMLELTSDVDVISWYLEGVEIQGETGVTIEVSAPGEYLAIAGEGQLCEARDSVIVTETAAPELNLGDPLLEACADDPLVLVLGTDTNGSVTWELDGTEIMGQNGLELAADESGTYMATMSNDDGCTSSVSQEVIFYDLAIAELEDLPTGICAGVAFPVEAMSDGFRFEWLDSDDIIAGADGLIQEFSQTGNYSFIAYNELDCPTRIDFQLEFIEAPIIDLGGASERRACVGETIELGTSSESGVTYQWSLDGSDLPGENDSEISVTESGLYALFAINDINCQATESVNVEFVEFPEITIDNAAETFCSGSDVTLRIDTDGQLITWTAPNGQVVGTDTETITVSEAGTYTITVTTPEDCEVSETIEVTEVTLPPITFEDLELCPSDPDITVSVPAIFDDYSWQGGSVTSDDENLIVNYRSMAQTTTETIIFTGTDSNGCTATASFDVTYQASIVAEAAQDVFEICVGETVTIDITEGYEYEWTDPNGNLNSTSTASVIASPIETTTYEVTVSSVCPDDFVVIPITVTVNPLPIADAGEDRTVLVDRVFQLQASGGVSYQWDNTDLIEGSNTISDPEALLSDEDATFTVTVTDQNGCTATDDIMVTINSDPSSVVKVINMFTPNGDGKNDVLEFEGLEIFDDVKLTVFNRWGNVVFTRISYQKDDFRWNGMKDGVPLASDTYYYILEFDGFKQKSSLTLIRD